MANCLEIFQQFYPIYISNLKEEKEDKALKDKVVRNFPCEWDSEKEEIDINIFLYEKWLEDEGRKLREPSKPALDIIIILDNTLLAIEYKEPEITSTNEYKNLLKPKETIEKSVKDLLSSKKVKEYIEKIVTNILEKYTYFCTLARDDSYPFGKCENLICFILITLSAKKFYKLLDTDPAVLMKNLSQHQSLQQTEFLHIKIQEIHSRLLNKIKIVLEEKFNENIECCNHKFFSDCIELKRLIESLKHKYKTIPPQGYQR